MAPKRKKEASPPSKKRGDSSPPRSKSKAALDVPSSVAYLITCDVPTKQFIQYLNELKSADKKFIIEDLDATHLLIKKKARPEIERKVEEWMDENVFSAVEKVGEDLDTS